MPTALWKNNYVTRKSFALIHQTTGSASDSGTYYLAVCNDGQGGYDFKVNNQGAWVQGQDCGGAGEHCGGEFGPFCNQNSVGIAMCGCFGGCQVPGQPNTPNTWPTAAQENRVGWIYANLCMTQTNVLANDFRPHRLYKSTACCGNFLCTNSTTNNKWSSAGMSMLSRIWKAGQNAGVTGC